MEIVHSAEMKTFLSAVVTVLLFCDCAGIERAQTKRRTDSQLKLRHSQVERELSGLRLGDHAERTVDLLEAERDAIERELLSRCEAGDQNACLPQFGR
jgi:hypothetical protein